MRERKVDFFGLDEMSYVLEMNWIDATEMWLNINMASLLPLFHTHDGASL
jgi:hypothetical protein